MYSPLMLRPVLRICSMSGGPTNIPLHQQFDAQGNPLTDDARLALDEFEEATARVTQSANMNGALDGWAGVPDPRIPPAEAAERVAAPVPDKGFDPDAGWDTSGPGNFIE